VYRIDIISIYERIWEENMERSMFNDKKLSQSPGTIVSSSVLGAMY
jgi:hypothetical protein